MPVRLPMPEETEQAIQLDTLQWTVNNPARQAMARTFHNGAVAFWFGEDGETQTNRDTIVDNLYEGSSDRIRKDMTQNPLTPLENFKENDCSIL